MKGTPFSSRPVAPAEARYFQLMAIGFLDEEPEIPRLPRAATRAVPLPALIGARPFGIMAIGSLDDDVMAPTWRAAAA